jgi:LAO/AO transport system kinase
MSLHERVLAGDRLALARLLTLIENEDPSGLQALAALYPSGGHARLVGITGPPGSGKSTLVNRLALHLRHVAGEAAVAIVAVDPSSPFTGGAILGDRIRMRDLAGDPGVFIRSMASRGALGGLARATLDLVEALDAAGFGLILIETVGAGQAEVDIAHAAHTTVVVDAPSLGDDVQAIKAGVLEVADIVVVNKADLPGADKTAQALRASLDLGRTARGRATGWSTPVVMTVATRGDGVPELAEALARHRDFLRESGEEQGRARSRLRAEIEALLRERLMSRFLEAQPDGRLEQAVEQVLAHRTSPREAVRRLLEGRP